MILKSFKYSTHDWSLDSLTIGKSNLMVGKNATGKTRTMYAFAQITNLLSKAKDIDIDANFYAELVFDDEGHELKLILEIGEKTIKKEILSINDQVLIFRNTESALIEGMLVDPPESALLLHVRRDVKDFPYTEKIIGWASQSVIRSFIDVNHPTEEQLYELVDGFTDEERKHVVEAANKIGFPIIDFDTFPRMMKRKLSSGLEFPDIYEKLQFTVFTEKDVEPILPFKAMSEGMRRTVLLLILLEKIVQYKSEAFLVVDDLGEGLDYTRATKVGRLLFDTCREHGIQLVAASNEEFMMNIVDIDCWNILVRHGQTVKSFTKDDAPELFEEFRFSGLDNFDFFTSDRLNRALKAHFGDNE